MSRTEELIKQEIKRWGAMSFERFVELALYHPQYGYYSRQQPQRGRQGDYFTSLQTSDLFPQILAEVVLQMRQHLDASQFTLVEFGSGGGELLEGVLTILHQRKELRGMRVISVERSASARRVITKRLSRFAKCEVVPSLDEADTFGGLEGLVLSNEFFDALPFQRYRYDGSTWNEIRIDMDGDELREKEIHAEVPDILNAITDEKVTGQEVEVRPATATWFQELAPHFERGAVVTFDYGYPRRQLYSSRRMKGTWLCYYQHQLVENALLNIGRQDITAHVDFTQLLEEGQRHGFNPALFSSQGLFLTYAGQKVIEDFLTKASELQKAKRIGAVQQLLHPDAMGEAFWVLLQTKKMDLPAVFNQIPNRLKRLSNI